MPRARRALRRCLPLVGWVACWAMASSTTAHVVVGTQSLHLRVAEADVILRGRVVDPSAQYESADGQTRRSLVEVAVLEELKGEAQADPVRIAQDGHADATYRAGDEALFFLRPIARSRELRSLAVPGGATHVSSQEHDEAFVIEGLTGSVLLTATRSFVASERAETTADRVALIRTATLDLLTSGDPGLAAAALASLVMSPRAEWITPEDLPRLQTTLANPANPIGFRAGLIDELERRGLVAGDPERLHLLRSTPPDELPSAIRAVGPRAGPAARDHLLGLVSRDAGATEAVVSEAAIALGASRDLRALEALEALLTREEARARNAAIRGLGLFGGPGAERILSEAAASHPDPGTRRRAQAELRKSRARSARSH